MILTVNNNEWCVWQNDNETVKTTKMLLVEYNKYENINKMQIKTSKNLLKVVQGYALSPTSIVSL